MGRRVCYLLHFIDPATGEPARLAHAGHYLGSTPAGRLDERLEEHRAGLGSVLTAAARAAGLDFVVVRTWPGDRTKERQLKSSPGTRYCPECTEHPRDGNARPGAKHLTRRQRERAAALRAAEPERKERTPLWLMERTAYPTQPDERGAEEARQFAASLPPGTQIPAWHPAADFLPGPDHAPEDCAIAQEQEEEMFGSNRRARARAARAAQGEVARLMGEVAQLNEQIDEQMDPQVRARREAARAAADARQTEAGAAPNYRRELTAERAARIRAGLGEDLARDARAQRGEPALQGAERDAEIDRLAGTYAEAAADGGAPVLGPRADGTYAGAIDSELAEQMADAAGGGPALQQERAAAQSPWHLPPAGRNMGAPAPGVPWPGAEEDPFARERRQAEREVPSWTLRDASDPSRANVPPPPAARMRRAPATRRDEAVEGEDLAEDFDLEDYPDDIPVPGSPEAEPVQGPGDEPGEDAARVEPLGDGYDISGLPVNAPADIAGDRQVVQDFPVLSEAEARQLGQLEGLEYATAVDTLVAEGRIQRGPYGPVVTELDRQMTLGWLEQDQEIHEQLAEEAAAAAADQEPWAGEAPPVSQEMNIALDRLGVAQRDRTRAEERYAAAAEEQRLALLAQDQEHTPEASGRAVAARLDRIEAGYALSSANTDVASAVEQLHAIESRPDRAARQRDLQETVAGDGEHAQQLHREAMYAASQARSGNLRGDRAAVELARAQIRDAMGDYRTATADAYEAAAEMQATEAGPDDQARQEAADFHNTARQQRVAAEIRDAEENAQLHRWGTEQAAQEEAGQEPETDYPWATREEQRAAREAMDREAAIEAAEYAEERLYVPIPGVSSAAWDRYVTSQPGSDEHKAAYVAMHREANGQGFPYPDPDQSYLTDHGYETDADRWLTPEDIDDRRLTPEDIETSAEPDDRELREQLADAQEADAQHAEPYLPQDSGRFPLPHVLEAGEANPALAPLAAELPDGTAHVDPFRADRGWQASAGMSARGPQAQLEAG